MNRNIDKMGDASPDDVEAVREGYVEWLGHQGIFFAEYILSSDDSTVGGLVGAADI